MKKTNTFKTAVLVTITSFCAIASNAQMVGTDGYFKGNYIELGLNGSGGFEGLDTTGVTLPFGYHPRSASSVFGMVANPQMDSWSNFNGDYFAPGSPENGWGFELGDNGYNNFELGMFGSNNCNYYNDIPGAFIRWDHLGSYSYATWESNTLSNLSYHINFLLGDDDLYYTTTVTVENSGADTLTDIYFYRSMDPDNNQELSGDYSTTNTILSQGLLAEVKAESAVPYNSYISFAIVDNDGGTVNAGYGGFANRDASDLFNCGPMTGLVQTVGSSGFADMAMFVADKINQLLPGQKHTFKYATIFTDSVAYLAHAALNMTHPLYAPVCYTDAPFVLTSGLPTGGTYSGLGVVAGNTFDPSLVGTGKYDILYTVTGPDGIATTAISYIEVDYCLPTGLEEDKTALRDINLFPNPAENLVTVDLTNFPEATEVQVLDVIGNIALRKPSDKSNLTSFDVSELAKGVYTVKVMSKNKTAMPKKLIVK